MKKPFLSIFSLVFLIGIAFVQPSYAQFEGKVVYDIYEVGGDGQKIKKDRFTMFVTPERILLRGENRYDFIGNIKTEGVLIRMDFNDFVFLTGDSKALKISKSDIKSMMNMFGDDSGGKASDTRTGMDTDLNYERTGDTKEINGYTCEKFLFRDTEDESSHAEVWMTKEVKINWGMLAEPWGNNTEALISESFPFTLVFEEGFFPLKMESYKSGRLQAVTEIDEITSSSIAKAMVQVPSGVRVLSFQDYLFQKMSEQ